MRKNSVLSLVKSEKRKEYPLSPIQQGIYVQSMLDIEGCAYNIPGAFKFEDKPDLQRLESAFIALIREDAIFRTVFVQSENSIVARVLNDVSFEFETIDGRTFEEASNAFLRPFDLTRAPLLRAGVWCSPYDEWYLFVDSHHIIGDGMSTSVILQRLDNNNSLSKILFYLIMFI